MRSPIGHILLLWQSFRQTHLTSPLPNMAPAPASSHLGSPQWTISSPKIQQHQGLLAPTPPMGYNNWARFECHLNQQLFTETADWMATHGLLAAGYDTITIDDCWMTMNRNPITKQLIVNSTLFPRGLAWLSQYIHQRGFKFGIYQDAGHRTCGGYPGSQGFYDIDVAQFASWEVDYIKLDGCNINRNESLPPGKTLEPTFRQLYQQFGTAIQSQSRPMVFSESAPAYFSGEDANTGDGVGEDWYKIHTWIGLYGQLWRHSTDVAVYRKDGKSRWGSVMTNYRFNTRLARFQKPGNWNDPDFLITGDDEGLTMEEQKSQFALWSIMASPLILSTDVRLLGQEQIAFLTDMDIIDINQDPLGIQGRIVWSTDQADVLVKPLLNPSTRAVAILNKQDVAADVSVSLAALGYTSTNACIYSVHELFSKVQYADTIDNLHNDNMLTVFLQPHATALYKITTLSNDPYCYATIPTGAIYLTSSLLCLDVHDSGTAPGTPVLANPCTGNKNQLWQASTTPLFTRNTPTTWSDPRGLLWIKAGDNLCLDTELGNTKPESGSKIVVNHCDATRETQEWIYEPLLGTLFQMTTGFCVDALGAGPEIGKSGFSLRLWTCGFQEHSQVWSLPA